MIDPVIFSFKLFGLPIVLRWYGVLVMLGAVVGALVAEREIKRRGENGESIWDAMVWVLPVGILGARLWYVINNILGGSAYYIDNPIKILYIWEGGLHIFGGFLFGLIALYFFLKNVGKDVWLFLDAIAPAALLGQALARPANFINQELYGQPTKLPWGIPIDAQHRLPQFADLSEATRFHPTFAYEMILNILLALLLLWISRQYKDKVKPGAIFSLWLVFAGLARTFIELFRPDQPLIGDSFITYTMLISFLMAIAGLVMLLARYGKVKLAMAEGWEEEYHITPVEKKARPRAAAPAALSEMNEEVTSKKSDNDVFTSTGSKSTVTSSSKGKKAAPTKKSAAKPKTTKSKTTKQKTTTTKTTKPKTTKK